MRLIIAAVALLVLGLIISSIAALILKGRSFKMAQGEVRCEGTGAIIVNIAGEDYAVNAIAGWQVQRVWNKATYPETDIDRLIVFAV